MSFPINERSLLSSIYYPKVKLESCNTAVFFPEGRTFFFAYARSALKEGLVCCGIGKGDTVLVPAFVCKELLISFFDLGINIEFYKVGKDLICDYDEIEKKIESSCKALLYVNYFGFPYGGANRLRELSNQHNFILIEDNAHGFLSRDKDSMLGFSGDIGIFSFRKTISVPNGAALVFNNEILREKSKTKNVKNKISYLGKSEVKYILKEMIRPLMSSGGIVFRRNVLTALIKIRKNIKKSISPSEKGACEEPFSFLSKLLLRRIDFEKEAKRRRRLYLELDHFFLNEKECFPLYAKLASGVVPYGYPFYYYGDNVASFQKKMFKNGLISINWPDLPEKVMLKLEDHYNRVLLIPFLW